MLGQIWNEGGSFGFFLRGFGATSFFGTDAR
jgi:hypothetical protein